MDHSGAPNGRLKIYALNVQCYASLSRAGPSSVVRGPWSVVLASWRILHLFCGADCAIRERMKRLAAATLGLLVLLAGCQPPDSIPQGVRVYFSPHGGATDAVVSALEHATNTVLVQAYSFTSAPIARALVDAKRRGLKVEVILDKSQRTEKYSEADFLKNEGVPPLIDAEHAIAHNKIMVIDEYLVLTGSFNFTKAAEENNAENLLLINDPQLAKQYAENWRAHARHSEPYERAPTAERPVEHRTRKILN
jgi:phosphatidylserine/phosphatidylglycerophosphate/cardiolipin synthase-like enzyme